MGGFHSLRRRPGGRLLRPPAACISKLPDERRRFCHADFEAEAATALRSPGAADRGGQGVLPQLPGPHDTRDGAGPGCRKHRAGCGNGRGRGDHCLLDRQ